MIMNILGGGTAFVADVAEQVGWLVLPAVALFLAIRNLWQHVLLVAGAAVGLVILTRIAALGSMPVFSNGALEFAGTCAVLLLVFLPVLTPHARKPAMVGTAALIGGFETIRVLAGQQSAVPTMVGALIGVAWVTALSILFRSWRQPASPRRRLRDGLPVNDLDALQPAKPLNRSGTRRRWAHVTAVGVALLVALVGAGLLITGPLDVVASVDRALVEWFAGHRSDPLSSLATAAGSFGTTPGIVAVLLVSVPLILALTHRWAPAVLLLTAAVGETALYLLTGLVVGRQRPAVDHLTEGLPPTSSFPSGHVAAAVVVYGGLALLIYSTGRPWVRWTGFIAAIPIVLGVAVSRVYWGMHFPSDVLASLVYAPVWLAACWTYLLRKRVPGRETATQTTARKEP